MVSSNEESLIYNIKLSSVGPGKVTGQDAVYEPSNVDLAMKLHYLRGVYYFPSQAFQGLTIMKIKEPTFSWLNDYYMTCGRFRRSDSGRPYIKCNDCGVRFIEAQCDKTLEEWLEMKDASLEKLLVSNQVLGPELAFSPPVIMQATAAAICRNSLGALIEGQIWHFTSLTSSRRVSRFELTKFKCGGVSIGLSWSHVLGDAFSATEYMNAFGYFMAGNKPTLSINMATSNINSNPLQNPQKAAEDPLSVKRVGPVEDHWIATTNSRMESFSFHITATELSHLQSKISGKDVTDLAPFETICAVIWQCIAKVREGDEPKVVTICRKDSKTKMDKLVSNSQLVSVVQADFSILEAKPSELAMLINTAAMDERRKIEEAMERDQGASDFILYGANLTFVNLEEANFYELEIQEHKPVCVSYTIDGVGDEGAVLVLPGPKNAEKDGDEGRIVTVILPENQVMEVKSELKKNGLLS